MIARAKTLLALVLTAVVLSGCYVYATAIPATQDGGVAIDHRLQGTWYVLKADGTPDGTLLHFMVPGDGGPMRMVSTNGQDYGVFEVHSMQVDDLRVFAMRKLAGPVAGRTHISANSAMFVVGTYRIDGDTLSVRTYDAKLMADAVASGHVKGKVGRGAFPPVIFSGTPEDIARALAAPEVRAAIAKEPFPRARRLDVPGYPR